MRTNAFLQRAAAVLLLAAGVVVLDPAHAPAQQPPAAVFTEVDLVQRLGEWVPQDVVFRNEQGEVVPFGSFFRGKPVVLALVYYECPMICTEVLNGMVRSVRHLDLDLGKDYEIVTVSINPGETPALAASKKEKYLQSLGRAEAGAGWHFMTGEETSIRRLADAVGFHYVYDEATRQYAHPAGVMVLTPQGQIARYLYGVEYPPKDLKFALMEASNNTVGSAVDQVLLLCYKYDPMTGTYGLVVMNALRIGGVLTLLALGGIITFYLLRERRKRRQAAAVAH